MYSVILGIHVKTRSSAPRRHCHFASKSKTACLSIKCVLLYHTVYLGRYPPNLLVLASTLRGHQTETFRISRETDWAGIPCVERLLCSQRSGLQCNGRGGGDSSTGNRTWDTYVAIPLDHPLPSRLIYKHYRGKAILILNAFWGSVQRIVYIGLISA